MGRNKLCTKIYKRYCRPQISVNGSDAIYSPAVGILPGCCPSFRDRDMREYLQQDRIWQNHQ